MRAQRGSLATLGPLLALLLLGRRHVCCGEGMDRDSFIVENVGVEACVASVRSVSTATPRP